MLYSKEINLEYNRRQELTFCKVVPVQFFLIIKQMQ